MDLFAFVGWFVAVVCAVSVVWPLNVPLMALAYKVRRGTEPLDMDGRELWTRSALAAAGPAGMSLALLVLAYVLVQVATLPPGPTLLVLLMAYLTGGVFYVGWCWGYDEFTDGLGLFLIYLLLPGLPLILIGWILGLWMKVAENAPWLIHRPS